MSELPSLMIEQASRDAQQPALFSMPEEVETRMDLDGQYTAERLFARKPDIYRTVVELLGQGNSIRSIKRVCRVHHRTIEAVATRERIAIDTGKEKVLRDLRHLQTALVDSLAEDIMEDRMKPEGKPLALAIITDKIELLSGGVTSRSETVTTAADAPRTWDEWKDRTLKQVKGRDMGLGGGENGQGAPRVHQLGLGSGDLESHDLRELEGSDARSDADDGAEAADLGEQQGGGRGSASGAGGVETTTE